MSPSKSGRSSRQTQEVSPYKFDPPLPELKAHKFKCLADNPDEEGHYESTYNALRERDHQNFYLDGVSGTELEFGKDSQSNGVVAGQKVLCGLKFKQSVLLNEPLSRGFYTPSKPSKPRHNDDDGPEASNSMTTGLILQKSRKHYHFTYCVHGDKQNKIKF
jgi:hypothetical protein